MLLAFCSASIRRAAESECCPFPRTRGTTTHFLPLSYGFYVCAAACPAPRSFKRKRWFPDIARELSGKFSPDIPFLAPPKAGASAPAWVVQTTLDIPCGRLRKLTDHTIFSPSAILETMSRNLLFKSAY